MPCSSKYKCTLTTVQLTLHFLYYESTMLWILIAPCRKNQTKKKVTPQPHKFSSRRPSPLRVTHKVNGKLKARDCTEGVCEWGGEGANPHPHPHQRRTSYVSSDVFVRSELPVGCVARDRGRQVRTPFSYPKTGDWPEPPSTGRWW